MTNKTDNQKNTERLQKHVQELKKTVELGTEAVNKTSVILDKYRANKNK